VISSLVFLAKCTRCRKLCNACIAGILSAGMTASVSYAHVHNYTFRVSYSEIFANIIRRSGAVGDMLSKCFPARKFVNDNSIVKR
jgi:hypothetical protein